MQWSELERYRQLLQEYEAQLAERERLTAAYREAQAAGPDRAAEAQQLKEKLDEQFPQLKEQYDEITTLRKDIAEARDAAVAE
jgi:uncharacterized membrane protein